MGAKRYFKIAEEWGGGEGYKADMAGVPAGWIPIARREAGWIGIFHENAVTPVAPPLPEEPPPGAYLIGDFTVVVTPGPWFHGVMDTGFSVCEQNWQSMWVTIGGGPDVSIQRLVPASAKVELPWEQGGWTVANHDDGEVTISIGGHYYGLPYTNATEMAAALLTAAGA